MKITDFNPDTAIPALTGKVILVSGGTAGLGKQSILHFARHGPAHIFFTGRNETKAAAVIKEAQSESQQKTELTFLGCDFTSLSSIKHAAEELLAKTNRLDIVICNAGIMAPPCATTSDGYEIQFATNHLGHAVLLKYLLPLLNQTASQAEADVRVIFLTSTGYLAHPPEGVDFQAVRTDCSQWGAAAHWTCYGQSKLANVLYATELARRYPMILSVSVHPGVVGTDLYHDLPEEKKKQVIDNLPPEGMFEPAQGAYNTLWSATVDRNEVVNGALYMPVGELGHRDEKSKDSKLAEDLWIWTEEELKAY